VYTSFWWAQALDETIILKRIFRKWDWGGMNWNDLAQNRNEWLALVNAVMNLQVP
jgi:hypothetical protein